jgi:hypothetical protein
MATIETLKNKIRSYSTDMILSCVQQIGGGHVDHDQRMVRACLLDIYKKEKAKKWLRCF